MPILPPITYDNDAYYIDNHPAFLYSGEFHYFRVPRADWRRRMRLFRRAGGNCLATYIPWLIHAPAEGEYRFDDGQRDLEGLLAMAAEEGLYVIARPGPYQYSELLYAGLPRWLCEGYPELLARTVDGTVINPISVSYVHPLFLAKARAWFAEVCPRIARYTLSRGGPVAFTQFDNELVGIHTWYGSLDYNPEAMGFGQEDGRYARFLRAKYGSLEALNARYGADWTSFADARPLPTPGAGAREDTRRLKDYVDFELANTADYAAILAGWLREFGIDTPLVHNSANPGMNTLFLETRERLRDERFILGSDHYYTLGQNWGQNNPTPQYAARAFASLETLRLMGYPPTVYEMPGGNLSDWPPVTPSDAKACYLANVAFGLKGNNFYIYTGGPNIPGAGSTGDIYDYGAAIGADGEIRPLYHVQKAVGRFLRDNPWLAVAERAVDCRFAADLAAGRYEGNWGRDVAFSPADAETFLRTGPLTTAFCAGLSPALAEFEGWHNLAGSPTPLVVAGSTVMSAEKQQRLVDCLRAGGKMLIAPILPTLDENLDPCTLLADFLGAPPMTRAPNGVQVRLTIAGVTNILNNGDVFFPAVLPVAGKDGAWALPAGAETLGVDEFSGRPVAWRKHTPGGGTAIVLGVRWMHAMRDHERMLVNLLADLGLQQRLHVSNPNVWATRWSGEGHHALFLLNLLTSPQQVEVRCQIDGRERVAGPYRLPGITVKIVEW